MFILIKFTLLNNTFYESVYFYSAFLKELETTSGFFSIRMKRFDYRKRTLSFNKYYYFPCTRTLFDRLVFL